MSLIADLLPAQNILLDVDVAGKKRVFEEVSHLLAERYSLVAGEVFDCLFAREKLGSTALGQGVAIPHGRFAGVGDTAAVFMRLKEAVDFESPDGKPVDLVFAMLVPENAGNKHLEVLSRLADVFSVKGNRESLHAAVDADAVRAVFSI